MAAATLASAMFVAIAVVIAIDTHSQDPYMPYKRSPAGKKPVAGKPRSRKSPRRRRPRGRQHPSADGARRQEFHPSYVEVARYLCANGATNQELAEALGVATSTISLWAVTYPDFSDAMRVCKGEFDARIERSLAMRAVGYSFEAEKVFANGRRMTLKEHVPPDVQAQRLWLLNRRPPRVEGHLQD